VTFPTGPGTVGIEPVILPVSAEREANLTCLVWAPRCRYGVAYYRPVAVWPGGSLEADWEDFVRSADYSRFSIPADRPLVRIELRMLWVDLRHGAFDHIRPTELTVALAHPLRHVREAALLAVGRRQ
jgi:hypothetical protein